jgi:uncharacterized protein YkwD
MRLLSLRTASICTAGLLLTACGTSAEDATGNSVISATTMPNSTPAPDPVPIPDPTPVPDPTPIPDPTPTPDPNPAPTFEQEMLSAVNTARATGRQCGGANMPAVSALTWNGQLEQAAFSHSSNMANYDFFSHTGLDGKEVSQRVRDEGYNWRAVGENIAAGSPDVVAVMAGWLSSPGHCSNIMSENFTEMGAAVVTNNSASYRIYWTQVFAASF